MLGLVSAAAGYVLTRLNRPGALCAPALNSPLRIRLPGGMARATLLARTPYSWLVGPILQREGSATPEIGDLVTVEAPDHSGVTVFRSTILSVEDGRMSIRPPQNHYRRDRRASFRRKDISEWPTIVDGQPAMLVDLSVCGARVAGTSAKKGERLDMRIGDQAVVAWVLEPGLETRVIFEEPLEEYAVKSKTAPS